MKTFYVTKDTSLKEFTDAVYPQGSFCFAALLRSKDIKVNGLRVGKSVSLKRGDEVVYYTSPKQEGKLSHNVIFEDENIYVADKYSGVSSEALLSELGAKGEFYAVHRLDRNTQGLIIFAKNKVAEGELLSAFAERRTIKVYLALCKNNFKNQSATLSAYLLKDEKTSTVKVYDGEKKGAVKIVTQYSVVESRGDIALVRVTLHTGKTHQIRAHMAHIDCPVLGDNKYGDEQLNKKYNLKRQCLVSKILAFCIDGSLNYLNGKQFISRFEL
ncbi:MAG: RluA family pseudouridine synthase [Clostridia bacterium]|nr:RluA family pseudouridine synthase [Clostridia bacterium]